MTKNSKKTLKTKTKTPATSGGSSTRFAALDSDSEDDRTASPPPPPSTPALQPADIFTDPIYLAMLKKDGPLWGDLLIPVGTPMDISTLPPLAPLELPPARPLCGEEEFWAQPWAEAVECHWADCYDTSEVSDDDWIAMMTWLYSVGWEVTSETRKCVRAFPDNQPARVWVAPNRFELAAMKEEAPAHVHVGCSAPKPTPALAAPGSDKGRRKGTPIPRFCKAGKACEEAGCRYIHGDTIPRVNQPCSFGAACGASDPTGVKRSQCLHMHPGETWTEGMVITRPAPSN